MLSQIRVLATAVVLAGSATAQPPPGTPSPVDGNRVPAYGPTSAGTGTPLIPSFPVQPQPAMPQPYIPPRPQLSPYLNLFRGNTGGGISAIDYYNFVRPAEQATGSYIGRPLGQQPAGVRSGVGLSFGPDQVVDPIPVTRSAGTPSYFMNTGGYFNRMGTIGQAGRAGPPRAPTTGRR